MKRSLALLAGVSLALSAWQAEAAPVNIVNFTSQTTLTTTAATSGCTTGQVAFVAVTMYNGVLTGIGDSTGASYTVSPPTIFDVPNGSYVSTAMAKRVIGSGNQITTSTTFTATAGGLSDMVVEAYCIADGVGIPTTNDSSIGADGSATAPAPTASTSYQFFAAEAYGVDPTIVSGAPWTSLNHALGPGGQAGLLVGYRQTGSTAPVNWNGQVAGYNAIGFSEVSTSGGGGSTRHSLTTLGAGQ